MAPTASQDLALEAEATWFITKAKIEPCPRTEPHSHSCCPFLHPEEGVPRRDPLIYNYDSIFCYDLHNNKVCKRGLNCPYSHNLFEYNLHPARFRTRMCEYGDKCRRELCFFAHSESQLRARTGVKSYSGGRRSGRRHRAAAALRNALAGSAFGTPSARGSSNGLCFLQVPSPPGTDVGSGSSGNLMQLDPATHEALARLSLASTQQAGVAPVTLAQLQAPVLILQDGTAACSSADMLPTVSSNTAAYAAGSMPLSTGALSAGSDLVSTQGLGLGAVPAGSRQSLGVAAGVSMHSMSQAAGVLPLACNPPGTGLAAPSNSSAWPVGLTAQQQLLLAQQHQLLPLPIEQTPVLQSAQVQNQLLSSPESLWFPPAGSAGLDLGMAGVTAAVQPAVSSNALSIFAPVSAASLVQGASMDSAAVLQAQQLSMQLAAAGILPQGLPPAAGGDACQCPVLLLNYMGQQL